MSGSWRAGCESSPSTSRQRGSQEPYGIGHEASGTRQGSQIWQSARSPGNTISRSLHATSSTTSHSGSQHMIPSQSCQQSKAFGSIGSVVASQGSPAISIGPVRAFPPTARRLNLRQDTSNARRSLCNARSQRRPITCHLKHPTPQMPSPDHSPSSASLSASRPAC